MPTAPIVVAITFALAVFALGCEGRIGETSGPGGGRLPDAGRSAVETPGLPCDIAALLGSSCVSCHRAPPLPGVPMSLVTLADLTAPARSNPSITVAAMALARMQDATRPMPPPPAARPPATQIAAFGNWVAGGYGAPACDPGGGAPPTGTGDATGAGGSGAAGAPAAGGAGGGVGIIGTTGAAGTGGNAGGGAGASAGVPCDVQALFAARCVSCHGTRPAGGAPMSLVTYADLTAPARSDPARTTAQLAVARMQSTASPMPPPPAMRAATSEITTVSSWIAAGYPASGCGTGTGADGGTGAGADAGMGAPEGGVVIPDPFAVPPTCTSNTYWSGGGGSQIMNPGLACINCHRQNEGPSFVIAGTLYPTAHEPDRCNGAGAAGNAGARVVITAADGKTITLTPNAVGNFYYQGAVATPFRARVTYMGRERAMGQGQTSGDCNSCHTQNGANQAPGRILLP